MNVAYCPRCRHDEPYATVQVFANKGKGGIIPFRIGTCVKCSVCSAIFVVVLPEVIRRADENQGEGLLDR